MIEWVASRSHDLVEGFLRLLDHLPRSVALVAATVLTGAVALLVVKLTTHQKNLVRTRQKMMATLYEMRLFLDSPVRVLLSQVRLVAWSFAYTGQTLPALLILTVPLGLLYVHMDLRYGYRPLEVGEQVLLRAQLAEPRAASRVELEVDDGLRLESGPVVAPREGRVYYRLRVAEEGRHEVRLKVGDRTEAKGIAAAGGAVSLERVSGVESFWAMSAEPALSSDAPMSRIWIDHQPSEYELFGAPWWAVWLLGSMVAAFALRKPLKAEL